MISFVDRYARRRPGTAATSAPPAAPAAIIATITSGDGAPARRRPTVAPVIEPADPAEREQRTKRHRRPAVRLQHDVRRDAQPGRNARAEPILGNVRNPGADRSTWIAAAQVPVRDPNAPLRRRAHAGDRLGQLALPVAGDAGHRHDLAVPDRERHVLHRRHATVAVGPDSFELED